MLSENIIYYGTDEPLPEQIPLRAGPVKLLYEAGQLRHVNLEDAAVLHQVYAAVRDHNWDTIAGVISNLEIRDQGDHFHISFQMDHRQGDIDFAWQGAISGGADGTVIFEMDGIANRTFQRNRIGFCVLHPTPVAGKPCMVEHTDGSVETSVFPDRIAPHQPFFDIRAISHLVCEGVAARVLMEGDTFEMEDQRNWTDASFKTYCTPLGLPFPAVVEAGTRIWQRITLTLRGDIPSATTVDERDITFSVGTQARPLPKLGLSMASHGHGLTDLQTARLQVLQLNHLRVDLRLYKTGFVDVLKQAVHDAQRLGMQLELALFVSDHADQEFDDLRQVLDEWNPPLARLMVFHKDEKSISRQWVDAARQVLNDLFMPLGGGTDYFFTELNRERPPVDVLDFVVYSMNPQIHAFDNLSLVETLPVQAITVESTAAFSAGREIVVSPVTLKMRSNPNATGTQPETPPGQLPPQVDVRQMSLFGAGWTLGSIKYLAAAGASSVTYFETTGMRGIMAVDDAMPEPFYAPPMCVYPVYHVLADIAGYSDTLDSESSDPLRVDGLVLRNEYHVRVLLANYTSQHQQVRLNGIDGKVAIYHLDAGTVAEAMQNPETFRERHPQFMTMVDEALYLQLPPFSIFRIDAPR